MFSDSMRRIVEETDGGIGAVLMGYDGIAVDQFFRPADGVDLQMLTVEYANLVKEIKKTSEVLETGAMEEVAIKSERFHVVIRAVTAEYFVALALVRDGNFGKGRYLLMREAPKLRAELS